MDVPLAGGESLHVPLDPALSPAENMARYFRQAAKAERGLAATADRLAGLESELAALERGSAPPEPRPGLGAKARPAPDKALPRKLRGLAVAVFRTTDGFTVLRAKNAQAGHGLVARAAAPHDYWFHAADGPGAHVILRRDSPAALVPESSLVQAAQLAALKSWRSEDATAEVHMALAGDVRMAKGGKTGLAILDKVEQTLKVELDPSLEERLAAR